MRILIVEDDHIQLSDFLGPLREAFPHAEIQEVRTEHEFRQKLDAIAADPPDVVVIDVMIRWTKPAKVMPPVPDEVRAQGAQQAGFRCARLLHERGVRAPVLLITMLDTKDIGPDYQERDGLTLLQKEKSWDKLIRHIERVVPDRARR